MGLEAVGGKCVFSSEWDKFSQKTYEAWHGEKPHGDITRIDPATIPDHDILTGGFPCQPFSIAGKQHGFKDDRGNLFFHIMNIIAAKRPKVVFLENVKNLRGHDKGQTWYVIRRSLASLDYQVFSEVIDASSWVPQHRERFFIVAFDRHVIGGSVEFQFPTPPKTLTVLGDILEEKVEPKYTLSNKLWNYLQAYAAKHRAKGNGFGYSLAPLNGVTRTLRARYYKDGSEILIPQDFGQSNPRRLTPKEAQRLMGFPDFGIVVSDTQAYKQFGNAVVPAVITAVGRNIIDTLNVHKTKKKT